MKIFRKAKNLNLESWSSKYRKIMKIVGIFIDQSYKINDAEFIVNFFKLLIQAYKENDPNRDKKFIGK